MTKKCVFTDGMLARVKLPQTNGRITLRDTIMPSLICRISASGSKTFVVYKRIHGGMPERITIGRFPAVNVKEARRLAAKIHGAIAEGKNPAQVKRTLKQELTFEELFNDFFEKHSKVKKRTWKSDLSIYNLYLKKDIGKLKLSHITKAHIRTILADASTRISPYTSEAGEIQYVSGMTTNRIIALAKTVFNWGISLELCEINPVIGIKKSPEKSRTRFLQAEELPKFFVALEQEENDVVRDFILLSLLTGSRRANVLQMRWDQISFTRREWTIPRTKNDDHQIVTLCSEAYQILSNRKKVSISEFVFPGDGKAGYFHDPKKGWKRVLQRAGIENLRIHDLRRTLGSWQAKTGASLVVIGKSLGHKSLQATMVYARLDLEPVRDSVESATKAIFAAAKRKKIAPMFNEVSKRQLVGLNFSHLLGFKIN